LNSTHAHAKLLPRLLWRFARGPQRLTRCEQHRVLHSLSHSTGMQRCVRTAKPVVASPAAVAPKTSHSQPSRCTDTAASSVAWFVTSPIVFRMLLIDEASRYVTCCNTLRQNETAVALLSVGSSPGAAPARLDRADACCAIAEDVGFVEFHAVICPHRHINAFESGVTSVACCAAARTHASSLHQHQNIKVRHSDGLRCVQCPRSK
jgi:hypothetical protein